MAADFLLVALDWLLVGALLVPLHILFPRVRLFGFAPGRRSLLGIAVLHAAFITLMAYSEGLRAAIAICEPKAEFWRNRCCWQPQYCASPMVCRCSLDDQRLDLRAAGLHFGSLWMWRWRTERRDAFAHGSSDTRNVLIVGAGGVGRRVASYVEQHPAAGRKVCGFLDDERPSGME